MDGPATDAEVRCWCPRCETDFKDSVQNEERVCLTDGRMVRICLACLVQEVHNRKEGQR